MFAADKLHSENKQGLDMEKKTEKGRLSAAKEIASQRVSAFQPNSSNLKQSAATNKTRIERALSEANSKVPLFRKH